MSNFNEYVKPAGKDMSCQVRTDHNLSPINELDHQNNKNETQYSTNSKVSSVLYSSVKGGYLTSNTEASSEMDKRFKDEVLPIR